MTIAYGPGLAAYVDRLLLHTLLTQEEQQAVRGLKSEEVPAPAKRDLVAPGQTVDHAILVVAGLLGRFDLMSNGSRQITAFHVPGDMCDLHSVVSPTTGWGITALTASTVLHVPHDEIKGAALQYPELAMAFWRDTTLDASILAKWIANIGRKNAHARVAHLLCEMALRMERIGRGERHAYALELTQEQIGDATGLTAVHVNRTLRALRADGLISDRRKVIEILDWGRLAAVAEFDPAYLLLGEAGANASSARPRRLP